MNNIPRGVWLDDLTRQEAASRLDGNAVIVIPVASGGGSLPHLPLKTATVIARALGQKLLQRLPVIVAPVVDADAFPGPEALSQVLTVRVDEVRSLGGGRIAILDVALSGAVPLDVPGDVLMLRVCERSDADEYVTSCLMALDPRSVRMPLLPAGSRAEAFTGERGMAAEVDALADTLVAKWPDLS